MVARALATLWCRKKPAHTLSSFATGPVCVSNAPGQLQLLCNLPSESAFYSTAIASKEPACGAQRTLLPQASCVGSLATASVPSSQ